MQLKSIIATLVVSQVSAQAGEHCRSLSNGIVYDCGNNNDAFHIKDVILNEKPVKGKPLNIHLIGELNEKVKFGSKTFIKAFYNGMKVLDLDKDICELVQRNTRYKCPIKPQKKFNFNQTLVIPSYAPSGTYDIESYGFLQNNHRIYNVKIRAIL